MTLSFPTWLKSFCPIQRSLDGSGPKGVLHLADGHNNAGVTRWFQQRSPAQSRKLRSGRAVAKDSQLFTHCFSTLKTIMDKIF